MTIMDKVDVVRHLLELFFYVVTGPLVTIFAIKKLFRKKNPYAQTMELQKRLFELSQNNTKLFKENIVPLVHELGSDTNQTKKLSTKPAPDTASDETK